MDAKRIITHMNMDPDAVASAWAARVFIPGMKDAQVVFMPADYDGSNMGPDDVAVDMDAGGRGIKGMREGERTSSSFRVIMERHAPLEAQRALADLVKFIDAQDTFGSAYEHYLLPFHVDQETISVFARTGFNAVFRAVQSTNRDNDPQVFRIMSAILDGLLQNGRSRIRAEEEAGFAEYVNGDRRVAIMRNARYVGTANALFSRGVIMLVYVDGLNIGITNRHHPVRCDHPLIRAVVEKMGENDWFAHTAGFVYAHGTYKSPATKPSKVDPLDLARAALAALDAEAAAATGASTAA